MAAAACLGLACAAHPGAPVARPAPSNLTAAPRRVAAVVPQGSFDSLPVTPIVIDASADQGPLDLGRHALGHGGVNYLPLPERVVGGLARLRPRLIRIFIQEFFFIYPEHGRFDWSRLDPYMDALARTGAHVVAAITIKPKPLYPVIDPRIWRPNNVEEWQRVVGAMVKRYSVDRPIVTHWEVGNETDIGENGGCPYLITDVKDYAEYYRMTIAPILRAFPAAKVGGPGVANGSGALLPDFIALARKEGLRLDFVSWHLYADDPDKHAGLIRKYQAQLADFPAPRPQMFITEWSKGFDRVSVEDAAFDPRRAAVVASSIIAMTEAGDATSFYYHVWDQTTFVDSFRPFFREPRIMYHHWNEVPHRFGLFGVNGEVRPQYFVYDMLRRMGERRIAASVDEPALHVLASRAPGRVAVLVANYRPGKPDEGVTSRVVSLKFSGLRPGRTRLSVYRIDRASPFAPDDLELVPLEVRDTDVEASFAPQFLSPADSVALITLDELP